MKQAGSEFLSKAIGIKVKQLREKAGMSGREAADKIGVTRQWFAKIECGVCEPSISSLLKVAKALGCSIFDILDEPLGRKKTKEK